MPLQFFIDRGKTPTTGNIIIHFDSHPDVIVPNKHNWILTEACSGFFSTIVWIKPPWSTSIRDGTYHLTVGKDDFGEIGICNNLPIFISTCSYKSLEKLNNPKEVVLEVVTFGKYIEDNQQIDDFDKFMEKLRGKFPESGRYYLNVDLDFFSTCNPYIDLYDKADLYDNLIELYWFGVNENMDPKELNESLETRINQLKEIQRLWAHVAVRGFEVEPPKSDLWDDLQRIAKKLLSEYSEVDWELVHKAGCTWDDKGEPLVHHLTSREDIKKLIINTFGGLISTLPQRPAAITIPMLENNFCPKEDEEFIFKELISVIESRFGIQINEHYFT